MTSEMPTSSVLVDRLRQEGLRPTRQRLALARLLFGAGDRHVSAEVIDRMAAASGLGTSRGWDPRKR